MAQEFKILTEKVMRQAIDTGSKAIENNLPRIQFTELDAKLMKQAILMASAAIEKDIPIELKQEQGKHTVKLQVESQSKSNTDISR